MIDRNTVMDRYFLDCRCLLLELAATLDRHDRAPSASTAANNADERLLLLQRAIHILASPSLQPDRAERVLQLLSDPVG